MNLSLEFLTAPLYILEAPPVQKRVKLVPALEAGLAGRGLQPPLVVVGQEGGVVTARYRANEKHKTENHFSAPI